MTSLLNFSPASKCNRATFKIPDSFTLGFVLLFQTCDSLFGCGQYVNYHIVTGKAEFLEVHVHVDLMLVVRATRVGRSETETKVCLDHIWCEERLNFTPVILSFSLHYHNTNTNSFSLSLSLSHQMLLLMLHVVYYT